MPEEMFASQHGLDGSVAVTIPPQAMQGMSPLAIVGLVTALVKVAPAIMALWPEVMAIVDQIKAQLPQTPMGAPPP